MDKSYHTLDHHFTLPRVRQVEASRPLQWLRMGWDDMRANLAASLTYGLTFSVIGYLILHYATHMPYLFTAAISGFFLVGPMAAAGLYELSRRHGRGETVDFIGSWKGLKEHSDQLLYYGALLAFSLIGWERLSAILFALFYQGTVPNLDAFYRDLFLSGNYWQLTLVYVGVGGVLAIVVFVLSAISIPMVLDRDVDIFTAMATSLVAVGRNIPAMAVWAILIVALTAIGLATYMIAMIFIFPVLGHATWHAYRDLTRSG